MSTSAIPPVAGQDVAGLSEPERILDTFVAPSKTFEDIRRNASWWVPWLLISILSVVFVATIDKKIGFDRVSETQIQKSARAEQFDKLPPEQKQKQLAFSASITKYISYASPLFILLSLAVVAAVLMAVFNFGMGQQVSFQRSMAIVAYSWLPSLISSVLAIATLFVVDPEGYDIRKPVASNLGVLFDGKFLSSFLSAFDVFMIWTIALLAIGFSANTKVKRGTAFGVIFGVYLFYKLIVAGLGSMF